MANEFFVFGLAFFYMNLFFWGFHVLPRENWQILAAIPLRKGQDNTWKGLNLTYYGFFLAWAYTIGTAIMFVLLGAVQVPLRGIFPVSILIGALCLPASKIVARLVEKKPHTGTIGGASFIGIIFLPWIIWSTNRMLGPWMGFDLPVLTTLAVFSIAYTFGEGTGRLACISFGCCYGKPLSRCHPFWAGLFKKSHFIFTGKTKKIAYADGLDNEPVIPIQAVTSVVYITAALSGTYFFLQGSFVAAFLSTLLTTQLWRLASEFLRADYRGQARFSAYQWMSLASVGYALTLAYLFRFSQGPEADLIAGLASLWNPFVLIFVEFLWLTLFFVMGTSMVTGSSISIHLKKDRI